MTNETEIWEWLLESCQTISRKLCFPENIKDDIVSDTILKLMKNPEKALRIYEKKEHALLCILLKQSRNDNEKYMFEDHRDFSRYKKIMSICEEYNLEYCEENAHIFAYILSDKDFSISRIISVMRKKKPSAIFVQDISPQNRNSFSCINPKNNRLLTYNEIEL